MAVEEYRAWFEIADDADHAGTTIGTATAVASGDALWWYLAKAGITPAPPPPTSGRGYPRGTA